MSGKERGVTIMELVMVMACMGILAAVALPNWAKTAWPAYRLKNAVHQVVADVRYARIRAVATNRSYRLRFDPAGDAYAVEKKNVDGESPPWLEEGNVRSFGTGAGTSFKGIRIIGSGEYAIVFGPTGSVTPATVTLQNSLGRTMKVVCSMAGRIRVSRE